MLPESPLSDPQPKDAEVPGLFGSWRRLYALVLAELALLILLMYLFRRAFE